MGDSFENVPEFTSTSCEWNETFRACRTCNCKHKWNCKKNLKTLRSGPKGGDKLGCPSQIGPYLTPLLQMREVWKFYYGCYSSRWSFLVADIFFPRVLFFGKILWKMLIFHVFSAQISLWSRNQFLIFISTLEWSNCPLFNAEKRRAVACSGTERQSHLWDLLLIFSQLCIPLR